MRKMSLNYENLNDKDLIVLLGSDLGAVFNLLDIDDIFKYYLDHNYTMYDILISILELRFDSVHYKTFISGKNNKQQKIVMRGKTAIKHFLKELDVYIKNNPEESIMSSKDIDLQTLYNYIFVINNIGQKLIIKKYNTLKELLEFDNINGNRIVKYVDVNIINNELYESRYKYISTTFIYIQYITGIRWKNNKTNGIFHPEHLTCIDLNDCLLLILMDLKHKKEYNKEFKDNFESELYSVLNLKYFKLNV